MINRRRSTPAVEAARVASPSRWPGYALLLALISAGPLAAAEPGWAEFAGKVAAGPQSLALNDCAGPAKLAGVVVEHSDFKVVPAGTRSKAGCMPAADYMTGRLPSADFKLDAIKSAQTYIAAPPDLRKFIAEDAKAAGAPYRVGVVVATPGIAFAKGQPQTGTLTALPDGRQLWRTALLSPGALWVDFEFAKLNLPAGAELFITTPRGDVVRGPIRAADVQASGSFYSAYVPGDTAIIEVAMTPQAVAATHVEVTSLTHAYRGLIDNDVGAKSGSCNVDTICPLGDNWRDLIDSVGHYTLRNGGSTFVCTGSLIANTRRDTTPYFLTANHCLSTEAVADTVVVYWNFQSPTCRTPGSASSGTALPRSISTHNQSGSALIATNAASDFALLRLDSAVPTAANPFWTGWDIRGIAPPSAITIHHPSGDEKRISDTIIPLSVSAYLGATGSGTSHWRIADWNNGTTEGGSSGSGLWTPSKQLIGQLHGGNAACGNNESDWYGRLSESWTGGGTPSTRLRDWLDPTSTGATTLDGNRASTTPPSGGVDEPSVTGVVLPTPNPPNASCPAGFFIATVGDGPGSGLTPGAFGMELLLDQPGTRVLAGGLNFGGLVDTGQVGFAGFNFTNAALENQRLNLSLTGSASSSTSTPLAVRVKIIRQATSAVVYEATGNLSMATASVASVILPPDFYVATVAAENGGAAGGAPEGQFFFSLTTSFVDRAGGGFQGGAVVGGYHATHPFGGVSGFAGFCLATPHTASMRVLSAPSYGASGSRDMQLKILDAAQATIVAVPTTGGGGTTVTALSNGVAVNGSTNSSSANSSFVDYTVTVPAGSSNLSIATTNGTGDLDLYVRFGATPSLSTYDCRPFLVGGNETCTFATPGAGTYYVRVYGAATGAQSYTIRATWTTGASNALANGVTVNGSTNSTTQNSSFVEYVVQIPSGASNFNVATATSGGDVDLYVRLGAAPTTSVYDCRSFNTGGNESCTFAAPTAGTYYVRVYGYDIGTIAYSVRATWSGGASNQ